MIVLIRVIAALLLLPMAAFAADIFVDANPGQDCSGNYSISARDCSGSDGDSYDTIAEGETALSAGDTLQIRAGTYRITKVTWDQDYASLVTVQTYNSESVIIKPTETDYAEGNYPLFFVSGQNLKFTGGIEFDGEMATNCTGACETHGNHNYHFAIGNSSSQDAGVLSWGADNIIVHDFAHAGLKGGNWEAIQNSEIYDIGKGRYDHAAYIWGDGVVVKNNYIHDIAGYGVHGYSSAENFEILYNIITNCGTDTTDPQDCSAVLIAGSGAKIYGNTFDTGDNGLTIFGSNRDSILFRNNISMGMRQYDLVIADSGTIGTNCDFTNNIYASDSICSGCANNAATFDDIGAGANISTDPTFIVASPADWDDYRAASGGSQVDAGADLGDSYDDALDPTDLTWPPSTTDQDGHGEGWEIGAFVFGVPGGARSVTWTSGVQIK